MAWFLLAVFARPYSEKPQESKGHRSPFWVPGKYVPFLLSTSLLHLTGTTLSEKRNSKMKGGLVYTMPGGPRARIPGQYFHSLLGTKSLVGAWQTGSQGLM